MAVVQNVKSDKNAQLIQLENGINKIIIPPTKEAIDDQFEIIIELIKQHESSETNKLLLMFIIGDISKVPTGYFVSRARKVWPANKPEHLVMRAAYMVQKNIFVDLLQAFMATLRLKSERNFFNMTQEEEATEWLLSGRKIE